MLKYYWADIVMKGTYQATPGEREVVSTLAMPQTHTHAPLASHFVPRGSIGMLRIHEGRHGSLI